MRTGSVPQGERESGREAHAVRLRYVRKHFGRRRGHTPRSSETPFRTTSYTENISLWRDS